MKILNLDFFWEMCPESRCAEHEIFWFQLIIAFPVISINFNFSHSSFYVIFPRATLNQWYRICSSNEEFTKMYLLICGFPLAHSKELKYFLIATYPYHGRGGKSYTNKVHFNKWCTWNAHLSIGTYVFPFVHNEDLVLFDFSYPYYRRRGKLLTPGIRLISDTCYAYKRVHKIVSFDLYGNTHGIYIGNICIWNNIWNIFF